MKPEPVVAVVGATGLVGQEMIEILHDRDFPYDELRLFASANSKGDTIVIGDDDIEIEPLEEDSFEGVDIALFATDGVISAEYVPRAAKAGAISIDNSSHFRMEAGVPLVVPEVNPDAIGKDDKIIANPNCSTAQLVVVLDLLHKAAGLKRVVVSSYQSVSGAGKKALDELWDQSIAIFNQTQMPQEHFSAQIAFNCIPHIDTFLENGYTKEEMKIVNETRKILSLPELKITSTAVRVPVFHAHAESVNVELENELTPDQCAQLLEKAEGITVMPAHDIYPMQVHVAGEDDVYVGRIRKDESVKHGLDLWIVADNLRKGAALNAIQIAELLLPKN